MLLSSPHIYFQRKEIELKIDEEGKYTKKAHKNNPELSWGLCWLHSSLLGSGQETSLGSWRKNSHLVSCCPVPSHLEEGYFSTCMDRAAIHPSSSCRLGWWEELVLSQCGMGRPPWLGCSRSDQTSLTPPTLDGRVC